MNDSTPTQILTAPAPTVTPQIEPHTKAGVSESEAATLAKWTREDLAAGKISSEQAEKIFAELNTPTEQRALDMRTDEQKTLDTHFPVARPEDYRIAYADPGQNPPPMTKELKEFDSSARGGPYGRSA